MTITSIKYTAYRLITHHHISKAQIIWAAGFSCRAGHRNCKEEQFVLIIMTNTEKIQPLKMVEFSMMAKQ
jgi:hypothetical protein